MLAIWEALGHHRPGHASYLNGSEILVAKVPFIPGGCPVSYEPEADPAPLPGPLYAAVDQSCADTASAVKRGDEQTRTAGKVTEARRHRHGKGLRRGGFLDNRKKAEDVVGARRQENVPVRLPDVAP